MRFLVGGLLAAAASGCGGESANPVAPTDPPASNRAPSALRGIPEQVVLVGEDKQLDLQGYFEDPDGDPLTFQAASSDSGVVSASVAGNVLTLAAVSAGASDVTVTAADPGGLSAAQTFRATVEQPLNRAPLVSAPIPDQALKLNGNDTATIDLGRHFADPDGDPLTFQAASSDSGVVSASVAGNVLTLAAVSAGASDVTVTAADPGGLSAARTFRATVEPPPNRAPLVATPIPDHALMLSGNATATIDLGRHFVDPGGDPLAFQAASSDTGVVSASVTGNVLTLTAVSAGASDITITASDPGGLSAAQTFRATVEPAPNRGPLVSAPILGRTLKLNENEKATVDLALYFTDPDGDPLTFEATSSNTRVVTAGVSNGTLTLLAQDLGTANVSVTASDPGGLTATQTFSVTVESGRLSAELEVTKCQADGLGFVNVTVEGTVRAVAPLSSVLVTAYMDTQRLGGQALGDLAAGETRGFQIRGNATVGSSSRCLVELSAGGGNLTSAASVSFR